MFTRVTRRSRAQARRAARILNEHPAAVAGAEVRLLIWTVEDLIERLKYVADPELKRWRRQAAASLESARAAVADGEARLREQAGEFAEYGDAYVRNHPWTTLGALAVGLLAVGLWTGRSLIAE